MCHLLPLELYSSPGAVPSVVFIVLINSYQAVMGKFRGILFRTFNDGVFG
jgi:hypothetical protein